VATPTPPLTGERWAQVTAARVARLATVTPQGRPHAVPCCFALGHETGPPDSRPLTAYSAVDGKAKTTLALRRLENLAANPWASLLIDHYGEDWSELWWVRLDGPARVVADADERSTAVSLLEAKYEQYAVVGLPGPVIALEVAVVRSWPRPRRSDDQGRAR
jgi:PPOX class probable F420-dependent enzyme